jgi:hypothetical protein
MNLGIVLLQFCCLSLDNFKRAKIGVAKRGVGYYVCSGLENSAPNLSTEKDVLGNIIC